MIVKVRTVNMATGQVRGETEVNYNRRESVAWLDRHERWCLNHGFGVQKWNAKDGEPGNASN
jgi:hypothetical protein